MPDSLPGDLESAWSALNARLDELVEQSDDLVESSRLFRPGKWAPYSIQTKAANRKLAPQSVEVAKSGRKRFVPHGPYVASTYVSISGTCPSSCSFKDSGCYAQAGASHLTMARLDRAARGLEPVAISRAEAHGLASLWTRGVPQDGAQGGRDLRLHVGGDASCSAGARALADAVDGLQARGLGGAWSYTHRWRTIDRDAWGPIAVLASVETPDALTDAVRRGYAPAVTVGTFESSASWTTRGIKMIPCPYEASPNKPTCSACRLCMGDLGSRGQGIAFSVHGAESDRARHKLKVLNAQ